MFQKIYHKFHTSSLRGKLLKNIVVVLLIVSLLSIIATYFTVQGIVREAYDRLLAQTAKIYEVVITNYVNQNQSLPTGKNLQAIWSAYDNLGKQDSTGHRIRNDDKNAGFQLYNTQGKMILHSANAPRTPWRIKLKNGFSYDKTWRLYTLYNPTNSTWLILGHSLSNREATVHSLTLGLILPLVIVFIVLILFLPRIVLKGLYPLKQLAENLKQQDERHLTPISFSESSTELNQIITALNGLVRRVNHAIEREQHFVADAAHELRTPLTVINLYSQELQRKNRQQESKETFTLLDQGISQARRVVEQMLILSRTEGEKILAHTKTFNLILLLREILSLTGITAIKKSQRLELDTSEESSMMVHGHRALLYSLFSNLIDNAIRYTPEGGDITITIQSHNNNTHINIVDTGPGLTKEQKLRVLDRFYRGETGKTSGAGLGLAIVTSIIKQHHGTFELNNRPNTNGLIATVTLPLAQ